MVKVTLDMSTFKALASDTRLDILKTLDGKKMSLNDICRATNLNKATLHEHLSKLHEAGLVKRKEREGHKWVYYKLSWKGESLLHPENTRIVVLFSVTFFTFFLGFIQLINYARGKVIGFAQTIVGADSTQVYAAEDGLINTAVPTNLKYLTDIPLQNQTVVDLTRAIQQNANPKDLLGHAFSDSDIYWNVVSDASNYAMTEGTKNTLDNVVGDAASNVPTAMVATVQDPNLLYIGIGCVIIFIVLILIGVWRLWENKTPKL